MSHVVWIKNKMPTRPLDGSTPFEVRYKGKPDTAHVVPFGTLL